MNQHTSNLQDIDYRNINKTFLSWVGINGNLTITKYIYYLGYNTEKILRLACSTLASVKTSNTEYYEVVRWLLVAGFPLPRDVMHYPCQSGDETLFHILAGYGGDLNFIENGPPNGSTGSPLFTAIANKHTNLIYHLHNYGADMTLKYQGWNPLHYACVDNNYQAVKALLSLGVPNVEDDYGHLPIHYTKDPNIMSLFTQW